MIKSPIWKKVEPTTFDSASSYRMCRIRQFTDPRANIGVYEITDRLPVYNEYFLVGSGDRRSPTRGRPTRAATLRSDGTSYNKTPFIQGPERDIFVQLLTFEAQQKFLGNQIEYTMTEPPLPATIGALSLPSSGPSPATSVATPPTPSGVSGMNRY